MFKTNKKMHDNGGCKTAIGAQKRIKNIKGANIGEYRLIVGLLALLTIGLIAAMGGNISSVFSRASTELAESNTGSTGTNTGGSGETGGGSTGGETTPPPSEPAPAGTDEACYTAQPGTIREPEWNGCAGTLIVSESMFRAAASNQAGGDNSFQIAPGDSYAPSGLSATYTFANGPTTIFTGQVGNFGASLSGNSFNGDISH